ncbi:MAG: biotin transporter BioY [Lachnospiraceae bacterium]
MKTKFSTKSMVMMALFSAILCVSAYGTILLPNGSHLTILNFMVMLISLLFPVYQSATIVLIWMLLGIFGVPVFAGGNGGIGYLLGLYGGYNFAFLIVAIFVPLVRGKQYNRIFYTLWSIVGALLVDIVGAIWWMIQGNLTITQAITMGVLPFLPLDFVKAIVAAQIVPLFRKIMKN